MKTMCKAKSFVGRMSAKRSGKAVGETTKPKGSLGASAGEKAMGVAKMRAPLMAKRSVHKGGNGG